MNDLINNLARQEVNGEISLSRAIDLAMEAGLDYEAASAAILLSGQVIAQEARQ